MTRETKLGIAVAGTFLTLVGVWAPTLGKIMGGGFPVGAIAGRKEFMAVFDPGHGKPALPHGGTFSANPVTMRAGLAAMELLDEAAFRPLDLMALSTPMTDEDIDMIIAAASEALAEVASSA